MTEMGTLLGTVDYVAPEQVRGEPLDARTDVYALTCVLFYVLTGQVPYPSDNDMAKIYAHAKREPPSPRAIEPSVPRQFDSVVARGMAKERLRRYLSAGDLGRAACAATVSQAATAPERSVATGGAALQGGAIPRARRGRPTELERRPRKPAGRESPPQRAAARGRSPARPRDRVSLHRSSRRMPMIRATVAATLAGLIGALLATGDEGAEPTPSADRTRAEPRREPKAKSDPKPSQAKPAAPVSTAAQSEPAEPESRSGYSGTYQECLDDPETTAEQCAALPGGSEYTGDYTDCIQDANTTYAQCQALDQQSTESGTSGASTYAGTYDECIADSETTLEECQPLEGGKTHHMTYDECIAESTTTLDECEWLPGGSNYSGRYEDCIADSDTTVDQCGALREE